MEEEIVREIMEEDYQKFKELMYKQDNYFNEEELNIVYKNMIIK